VTEDRTRVDRIDEELEARRARLEDSIDGAKRLKLAIPRDIQKQLDEEGRVGRWVSADPNRMAELTDPLHGYRAVDGVKPISTRDVNTGEPMKLKLMSKRKDFIADDQARKETKRRAKEEAQLSAADAPGFYADEANKFKRGGSG
jgi:hypothetical protein